MDDAYARSVSQVLSFFGVDSTRGLNDFQVAEHARLYGRNVLPQEGSTPFWKLVLKQFDDLLVKILIGAAIVSFLLALINGETGLTAFLEPSVILMILAANAAVGVITETNAEKALEELRAYQADIATVLRNGCFSILPASELVPGDIVEVSVGCKVPADMRMIEMFSDHLRVDQAILTGESCSVEKELDSSVTTNAVYQDKTNILFSGTVVVSGRGRAVVVGVGSNTAMGSIHDSMLRTEDEVTPLKKKLDEFGTFLAKVIAGICILVWVVNIGHFRDPAHGGFLRGAIHYFKQVGTAVDNQPTAVTRSSYGQAKASHTLSLSLPIFLSPPPNDLSGNASVTSRFIRSEFPSTDISLDNEAFAVPKGYNAPQQVHITQGDYNGNAVIISWVTAETPGSNTVQYGISEKKYIFSAEGTVSNYTFYNYTSGYIHHCLVKGLQYSTKYFYKLGDGDSAREFWFQTPPKIDADTPYKFGIIGDLGQTYNSLSTVEHYMQSGAEAVLFVGDLSYADRYKYHDVGVRWDTWGRFIERVAAYQPWIWSAGNHEIEYMPYMGEVTPFKSFLQRYPTPYAASKSTDPLWYAVRRASAHIIVISSYSPFVKYTPQWRWLGAELKRVDREKTPWLIVLMHVPIYNSNDAHFMEGESMRAVFECEFVKHKVDVIFAGHVHAYERSYRISNIHYNVSTGDAYPVADKSAPVYITVGDGGNQEGLASKFRDPQPDYSAFREASYGHSTLEIMNRTHAVYHWNRNDDGKKVQTDSFTLHNQYWGRSRRRRKLNKNHLHSVIAPFTPKLRKQL